MTDWTKPEAYADPSPELVLDERRQALCDRLRARTLRTMWPTADDCRCIIKKDGDHDKPA